MKTKVIFVTGATRGLGRALSEELARRGHTVYAAARSWPEKVSLPFHPLTLDITDPAASASALKFILEKEGRLDVLVNNAGISQAGPVEDTPLDNARHVFETNYFGPVRLIQNVLPAMRAQGNGLIVNITSAASQISLPFQAHYTASKAALEALSVALHYEISPFGLRLLIVQPGDLRTSIWQNARSHLSSSPPYQPAFARFLAVKDEEMGERAAPAEAAARQIVRLIEYPPALGLRFPVPAKTRLLLLARKILPDRLFLPLVARHYRLHPRE